MNTVSPAAANTLPSIAKCSRFASFIAPRGAGRRPVGALVRAIRTACVAAVALIAATFDLGAVPPSNFAVENVVTELEQPITLRFLPDGRLLLLQKKGKIQIINVSTTPAQSELYMDLADPAHANGIKSDQERGLLDIAIDPDFPAQPYIYLFYTPASGGTRARIARFTHVENAGGLSSRGDPTSEVVLWQDTDGYDSCCHFGGGLNFGPDGKLWLTTGDHFQGSYAASLEHAGGGVIRINKDGTIPADNPWVDGAGPNHDALFAKGLRNPFRSRWDLPTGRLLIAEVGGNEQAIAWEDLHVLRYDLQTGRFIDQDYGTANDNGVYDGLNFGWPTVEGMPPHTDFPSADIQPVAEPIFGYRHNGVTAAINGGIVYRGSQFPAEYEGAYFYADSTRDFVRYIRFNPDGSLAPNPNPDPISEQNPDELSYAFDLAPQGRITCLDVGPDGALYYVSFTDAGGAYGQPNPSVLGAVRRYVYDGGNARPEIAEFTGTPTNGPAPLTVDFSIRATDAEGDAMTYVLDFDDGSAPTAPQALPNNTTVVVSHTYTSDGPRVARVFISDSSHTTTAFTSVEVGTPPTISSLTVTNSRPGATNDYFRYGDTLTFAATASDAEDGALSGASFEWSISFVRPGNTHPSFGPETGTTSVDFPIPAQGQGFSGPVFYRCFVTVTDSSGLSTSASIDIFPEKANITLDTVPSGIPIQVDGNTAKLSPFVLDTLINYEHVITVPDGRCVDGTQYTFANWSNGPTSVQQSYVVPPADSTLTANYTAAGPCAGPPTAGLVLRLNAGNGVVADGTAVAAWDDQSAQGNALVAAGSPTLIEGALNGEAAVHFDGVDDAILSSGFTGLPTGAGARSVFMVVRYNAAVASPAGWAGFSYGTGANNQAFGLALTPNGTLGVQGWGGSYDFVSNPATSGVGYWLTHSAVYGSGTIRQYVNGAAVGTANRTYNTGTTGIRIGEELNGGKNLDMDVAEILVYNRELSEAERLQIEEYFGERYGLATAGGAPVVTITAPADGASFTSEQMPLTLSASALDEEDGDISASVQWQSDLDGPLGTGGSISVTLSPGTHIVSAIVTDSSLQQDVDQVNVTATGSGGGSLVTEGLVVQLESDLNVSTQTGNTVAGWLDQSGLGNDLVASGDPQLVPSSTPSGLPSITLDGVNDKLERIHAVDPLGGMPAGNGNRTMFIVTRYNNSSAWGGVAYGTGAANQAFGLVVKHPTGELTVQGWGSGNDVVSTTTGLGAGWLVQSATLLDGTVTLYRDGVQIAQKAHTYGTTLTKFVIGQEISSTSGGFMNMDVAAVLVYERALSAAERSSVNVYLQEKYLQTGAGNTAPAVAINTPAEGATFTEGEAISFSGTAQDAEDGDLSASLQWQSNVDGPLGSGATINVTLTPGTHVVTATAADSALLQGSANVSVTVTGSGGGSGGSLVTAGLVLHLESDSSVSLQTGTTVASWLDQSGLGNDVAAAGAPQLVADLTPSGLPAIALNGAGDKLERIHASTPLNGLPTGNADRTAFIVARYNSSTAWGGAAYGTGAANQAFGLAVKHPTGELVLQGWGSGNDLTSTTAGRGAGWLVQSGILSGGTATLYKDGAQIAQFAHAYNTVLTKLVIGEEIKNAGFVGMDVAAVLIYDRALTSTERASVEGYLQTKYLVESSPQNSNTAPVVAISVPGDGSSFAPATSVTFTATATDNEQGDLSGSLSWNSDRDGGMGTGGSVITSTLSAGTHVVTASVSDDGGLPGVDSVSVTIGTNTSPAVSISAPADGATFAGGAPVTFSAAAMDAEDGDLSSALAWTSDLDGALGTGGSITISTLSPGTHVITASVTDSAGLAGVDSVTITIESTAALTPESLIQVFNGTSFDGLYPWFSTSGFSDPKGIFQLQNGMIRVGGNAWGGLTTQARYRDYVMVLEFKWGDLTWGARAGKARDAGVLIHSHGVEGGWDTRLMPAHQVQVMEGSMGDLILLKGTDAQGNTLPIGLTALVDQVSCVSTLWNCRGGYRWNDGGTPRSVIQKFAITHWTAWDPGWVDVTGHRGANDLDSPHGEWNQLVVVAEGDAITVHLNGAKVNDAFAVFPTEGKVQLEARQAEYYVRRWELWPLGHAPAPMITKETLPTGAVGAAYNTTVTAVSGVPPLAWSVSSGALPTGLTLHPMTGQISGVPLAAGASTFTVQVADDTGSQTAQSFTLTVTPAN